MDQFTFHSLQSTFYHSVALALFPLGEFNSKQSRVAAGACCAGFRFIFCMQTTWHSVVIDDG